MRKKISLSAISKIVPVSVPGPPGALARRDLSVAGPLARHVADLEQALTILAAPDEEEATAWRLELPPARVAALFSAFPYQPQLLQNK